MDSGIASKRSLFYYRSLIFLSLLVIVGLVFLLIFFFALIAGKLERHIFGLMCAGLFMIPFFIRLIHAQLKRVHSFSVTKNAITVKGKIYPVADIVNISFSGKKDYAGIESIEGMQITFKGNKILYVYDRYYSNIAQIKSYLDNIWQRTETSAQQAAITRLLNNIHPSEDHFYFHKGGILNWRLLILVCFLFMAILLLCNIPFNHALVMLILPFLFIIALSTNFYYFGIGEHFFMVKNFAYPWLKRPYALSQVKEILFESNRKAPHSITIIMNDFTKKKYYATTLYDKHWRKLKHDLIEKGIKVRDELHLG